MAWANLTEIAGISISYLSGVTTPPSNNIQYDALVLGQDESAWQRSYGYGTRVWNVSTNLYISVRVLSNSRMIEVVNPTSGTVFMRTSGGSGSAIKKADACFYINEDTQQACAVACYGTDYNNVWIESGAPNYSTELYQIIKGLIPPQYTWQSVPSISGKNGILQFMSTIVDMNDGEPVTTADTTKFTLVEESNVGVITEDIDDSIKPGADAGGISGSGSNSGNQSSGYAFGQGESGTNKSGGGGGYYGGYKSTV